MPEDEDERLQAELSLLQAMYPDQVIWIEKAREVRYSVSEGSFQLRLPDGYLEDQRPDVLSATVGKVSVRDHLKQQIRSLNMGEEVLDSIVSVFTDLVESSVRSNASSTTSDRGLGEGIGEKSHKATIVVWLHHLLNTNKRKQALAPPSPEVSGITKPGYPGVLVYSGPADAVHQHVNDLKQQNWQAFQVRLETEEQWIFSHGPGVKEVEAMKDVVAEIGGERKEVFMEAMRMK